MAATMRAKKFIINDLYTQMKSHGLTSSCTYNEYLKAVGATAAVHPRAIAKGWRGRWTVVMSQLKNYYPDIDEVINVVVEEEPKIDLSGLEALRALSANKEEEDGKDF